MFIHLHGNWLVLIGNVRINFGVIRHSVLSFSLSSRQMEILELNTKVNSDYIINSVFILRKSVNYSVNLFSNRSINSTTVFIHSCHPYNLYCVGRDVKHCSISQSRLYPLSSDRNTLGQYIMQAQQCHVWETWHCVSQYDEEKDTRRNTDHPMPYNRQTQQQRFHTRLTSRLARLVGFRTRNFFSRFSQSVDM